jgi:hypothetical protein
MPESAATMCEEVAKVIEECASLRVRLGETMASSNDAPGGQVRVPEKCTNTKMMSFHVHDNDPKP